MLRDEMLKFKDAAEARAAGFAVDTTVYPWLAYKGPRFNPTVFTYVPTDREAAAEMLRQAAENLIIATETRGFSLFDAVPNLRAALRAWREVTGAE